MEIRKILLIGLLLLVLGLFSCAARLNNLRQNMDESNWEWYSPPGLGSATVEPSTMH